MSAPRNRPRSRNERQVAKRAFDDEEWQTLKQLSGLADDAREDVEQVVRFLRAKPSLKNPLATEVQEGRENIRRASKSLEIALGDLNELLRSGIVFVFHPLPADPNSDVFAADSQHEAVSLRDSIDRFGNDLEYSIRRLKNTPSGRTKEHMTGALRWLNEILLERTGQPLNQKKTNRDGVNLSKFALQVCRKAQPLDVAAERELKITKVLNLIKELQSSRRTGKRNRSSPARRSK
jgi:hypothetical protein